MARAFRFSPAGAFHDDDARFSDFPPPRAVLPVRQTRPRRSSSAGSPTLTPWTATASNSASRCAALVVAPPRPLLRSAENAPQRLSSRDRSLVSLFPTTRRPLLPLPSLPGERAIQRILPRRRGREPPDAVVHGRQEPVQHLRRGVHGGETKRMRRLRLGRRLPARRVHGAQRRPGRHDRHGVRGQRSPVRVRRRRGRGGEFAGDADEG